MSSDERFAYLERVEAAARSYVDLVVDPSDGPGHAVVREVRAALDNLIAVVRPPVSGSGSSGLDDGVALDDRGSP